MNKTFWLIVMMGTCVVSLACSKSTKSTPAPTGAVTAESAERPAPVTATTTATDSKQYGKYYGSCLKKNGKLCTDGYCKGDACDKLMPSAKKNCDGTYSGTKCVADAKAICLMPTSIGDNTINAVNFYYDDGATAEACKNFGGKVLK